MLVDKNYIIFIIITVGRKGITKVDCGPGRRVGCILILKLEDMNFQHTG